MTAQQKRMIDKAIKKYGKISLCKDSFQNSFTRENIDGETYIIFWFNDESKSSHIIKEKETK